MRNAFSLLSAPGLLLALAACGADAPPAEEAEPAPAANSVAADAAAAEPRWVPLVRQGLGNRSATPLAFRATGEELRVITEAGPVSNPYLSGRVVTNILEDPLSLPTASVRLAISPLDTVRVDTTLVRAGPGTLYLFVAQQSGLAAWQVTVEERREESGDV